MINHAITGYACFLSCQDLRKTLIKFIRMVYATLPIKRNPVKLYAVESSNISSTRV